MEKNVPTAHNSAHIGDIADVVLMPGDPLRAKYIAENFLENPVCFNEVRGMLGFTGMYKGKKVSVMGSGMGMPSMGIYAYELYKFYNVKKIIRIGSCGAYTDDLELLDTFLVERAYTEGNFALTFMNSTEHIMSGSKNLNAKILSAAKKLNIDLKSGDALTSECFDWYIDIGSVLSRVPKDLKLDVAEMETFALFTVAKYLDKEATSILSVVDSHIKKTKVDSTSRERSLNDMIKIALEAAISDSERL